MTAVDGGGISVWEMASTDGVAAAFPKATDKVVVFVHGLSENEAYWNRAARPRTGAYSASKFALAGWSEALYLEERGHGLDAEAPQGIALGGQVLLIGGASGVPDK